MAIVMGIDPGTRLVGYGVVEAELRGDPRYLGGGTVRTTAKGSIAQRLNEVFRGLEEQVRHFQPDILAVEEAFVGRNIQSTMRLGEARGVILLLAARESLEVHQYPAARVKKAVVGNGRADKVQVQRMVQAILGLESIPQADAADALAVALCHCHRLSAPR
ncbi:MAG: crossover junction endodeoxyribonuclease RuvC [Planctomycetota bacterium]|jgi:crossover junction endodeoxyribonuclease RuvC|nr:crossover junction endodeoxyribonuclease RuvC [Planctomycetota bacterium]